MEDESHEVHSEDEKVLPEKSKKRTVKTRAQIEALEKIYDEHKYPTEPLKLQLAESLGLAEKQISGWFCHRRLKDKRLLNGETDVIRRQERSSGVVQDHGSGFKQDSCGSTKQVEDSNFDTKEVESGRLAGQEFSAVDLTYELGSHYTSNHNCINDASSGSSSSLRSMSFHHKGDLFDAASSGRLTPKFPVDAKSIKFRSGPSGYLKVKGQTENAAITAVKKQLGRHYREDGPPLGVEFEPLPPGAFESSMQDPVNEPYYAGEHVLPSTPDVSKVQKHPNLNEGYEYNYRGSHNFNMDGKNSKMAHGSGTSESYFQQKLKMKTNLYSHDDYFPGNNSSVTLPEVSRRDTPIYESKDSSRTRPRHGLELMRMDSVSSHPHLQTYGEKVRGERAEALFYNHNNVGAKISHGGNIEYSPSNLAIKGNEYDTPKDKGMPRRMTKDGKNHMERITGENCEPVGVIIPLKNEISTLKRARDEFPQQQHRKKPSLVDRLPCKHQLPRSVAEMPSSFSEDEESAETNSSVD